MSEQPRRLAPAGGAAGVNESPLHGPTLSTSTSSFEALDPHDPNLSRMATKMFQKTNEYVSHELNSTLDDYTLLEQLNRATISKYSDMNQIAENLTVSSADMKRKFDELMPKLQSIEEVEHGIRELESSAYMLDAYSQRLEEKFNTLMKKK